MGSSRQPATAVVDTNRLQRRPLQRREAIGFGLLQHHGHGDLLPATGVVTGQRRRIGCRRPRLPLPTLRDDIEGLP